MQRRPLGRTGQTVSSICLGTMTFGEQNTRDEAFEQMDYALAQGVDFFDTAELYPVPPRAETYTRTESILGEWFARRGTRNQVFLASKVAGRSGMAWIRGGPRLDRASIMAACDASLQRLRTDRIDLYQIHWPERRTNFFGKLGYTWDEREDDVAIEETLGALNELVQAGKAIHVGVSNETPWGVAEYLRLHRENGLPRIASIQNPYSLLNRSFEVGLAEFARREQIGLLAYSPMAFGVLSGKYLEGSRPENARLTLFGDHFTRYLNPQAEAATAAYADLARAHGLEPAAMALAFVTSRPFVTANIIGARTMEQLRANIAACSLELGNDLCNAIEDIHTRFPFPAP